ncbi:hypothetical protein F4778DRAFT_778798 [Xylariomycetidae sp. FL2044]|nr:hypothetical protein F4778DRAFT_778798 [Xylariomycetidae sp. FL2044]
MHESLQAFWKSLVSLEEKKLRQAKALTEDDIRNDLQVLSAHTSGEYLAEVDRERQTLLSRKALLETPTGVDAIKIPRIRVIDQQSAHKKIPATRRALSVVAALYPVSQADSSHVDWRIFVLTMRELGFSARNSGGSVVTFEAPQAQGGGRINIHRPHPVAKIDHVTAISLGRRLTRWFGWRRERFVPAEEGEVGGRPYEKETQASP